MATKPLIDLPEFANDPASDAGTVEPTQAKKDIGWLVGEKPARETFNWLHRSVYRWLVWCELSIDELNASKVPAGYLSGFDIANNPTDLDNDINFNEGVAASTGTGVAIDNTGEGYSNKYLNVAWAEGKNQGGLGNGLTKAADTWYRCFAIAKADGTVDFGFDTSATAANLLVSAATYSYYRQVGWIMTDASSNIKQFQQYGDVFTWQVVAKDLTQVDPSSSPILTTLSAPPETRASFFVQVFESGGEGDDSHAIFTSPSQPDTAPNANAYSMYIKDTSTNNDSARIRSMQLMTDASSQIRRRWSLSTSDYNYSMLTESWTDTRGRG